MHLNSLLLFIFPFVIKFHYTLSFWTKSKETLDNYVLDVLFSNCLTIIRCNPYESHVFRDLTIKEIGHLKCLNKNLFLPENHIESITLLQWNSTSVICKKKKKTIEEEKTTLLIKHKPKNAFKNIKLDLLRVGSTGSSDLKIDEKKFILSFKHPPRQGDQSDLEQKSENFTTDIYSFKNRPIICRERQLISDDPCSNQHLNLSYVCYYQIGIAEPPTIADMENEIRSLSKQINIDDHSKVDLYIDNRPSKSLFNQFPKIFIFILLLIIIVIIGIIIYCCCCRSRGDRHHDDIKHIDSDTSNLSNIS